MLLRLGWNVNQSPKARIKLLDIQIVLILNPFTDLGQFALVIESQEAINVATGRIESFQNELFFSAKSILTHL